MQATRKTEGHVGSPHGGGLTAPSRNRFFHGKLMDVYHFEMETAYGISMRRLVNRLVLGKGVVCGLDVLRGDDPCSIVVTSGMAIDGWGREIVVPDRTATIALAPALIERVCGEGKAQYADKDEAGYQRPERKHRSDEACVSVVLCYHECDTDPVAVLAGDCSTPTPCTPGAIREQYRIGFEPGAVPPVEIGCRFPDVLSHGDLDYGALARWVTRDCPSPPRNPCIPLANLHLDCQAGGCDIEDIDIEIRPIVFGNRVLFETLSRVVEAGRPADEYGH